MWMKIYKQQLVSFTFLIIITFINAFPKGHRNRTKIHLNNNHTVAKYTLNSTDDREVQLIPRTAEKDGYVGDFADQDIIFPDAYQVIFESKLKVNEPPNCATGHNTFCENYENYPSYRIKNILKNQRIRPEFFGTEETSEDKVNISNRIGEEEEFFCTSYQKTIFPNIGKNKNNKWKIIINQNDGNDKYIQGVRVETCRREGDSCNILGDLPFGYTAICKQKFIYRRLMSLDDNENVIPDSFLFPSACCCAYKKDVGILRRFSTTSVIESRRNFK